MIGISIISKLRNELTGLNSSTVWFDIIQSKLGALAISLDDVAVSMKNSERTARRQPSAVLLETLIEPSKGWLIAIFIKGYVNGK